MDKIKTLLNAETDEGSLIKIKILLRYKEAIEKMPRDLRPIIWFGKDENYGIS
jgi:hypothetical protein